MKPTNWDRRGRGEGWRKAQRSRWAEKGGERREEEEEEEREQAARGVSGCSVRPRLASGQARRPLPRPASPTLRPLAKFAKRRGRRRPRRGGGGEGARSPG